MDFLIHEESIHGRLLSLEKLAYKLIIGLDIITILVPKLGFEMLFLQTSPSKSFICTIADDFNSVIRDQISASFTSLLPAFRIVTEIMNPSQHQGTD